MCETKPVVGDYVLATKYGDGDPRDAFCVGHVSEFYHDRYVVVDNEGNSFRHNGFRRAERITPEEGEKLCALFPEIGDTQGVSMWRHLAEIRRANLSGFCSECGYERDGYCRCEEDDDEEDDEEDPRGEAPDTMAILLALRSRVVQQRASSQHAVDRARSQTHSSRLDHSAGVIEMADMVTIWLDEAIKKLENG